ncbi:MAG: membrane dipeptidase, partial [Lachnospiraceae bacterium]|nr:membrane dipeptidase [Lachnospiraceae bacterium]
MIADMHCDTLSEIRHMRADGKQVRLLDSENLHVNLNKMREGGYAVQNFAAFIYMGNGRDPFEDAMELVQLFEEEMRMNAQWIRPV